MRHLRAPALALLAVALVACGPGPDAEPDAGPIDGVPDAGPGSHPDDHGPVSCANAAIAPASGGACSYKEGSNGFLLLRGNVLTTERELKNGHVLVAPDGKIVCAACDCSAEEGFADARVVACAEGAISPGLINTHDHITYTGLAPHAPSTERYDHRHEWRKGLNGHTKIPSPSTPRAVSWGELRMVLGGATSLVGSGGAEGLVRNLDEIAAKQEGLGKKPVANQTFPLGDSGGKLLTSTCAYGSLDTPTESGIASADAYLPHVAEGIGDDARNEFLCLSGKQAGGSDLVMPKSAFIHGIGLLPQDYAAMAAEGTALIWSPRSNIDLYGITASVTVASRLGVQLALGTDWTASGSMNVLRELRCADNLNRNYYGGFFTDRDLVQLVTSNAAAVTASDDVLGSLAPGKWADIAVFSGTGRASGWRAVIDADAKDVLLVLRGGKVLFGEAALVDGLGATGCEPLDVCGAGRKVCAERETGKNIAGLRADAGTPYALFFCETPENEPSCMPTRPDQFTGQSRPDDQDGDGVANAADNCPSVFNPLRLVDGATQGDVDGDGRGDACDVCPMNADASECAPPDADDGDLDGVKDAGDNCPKTPNADQRDTDTDGKGDACDDCPAVANPGDAACLVSIYDVKQGVVTSRVTIANVLVTAAGPTGYFVQVKPGDAGYAGEAWSGLFVYAGAAQKPPVGTRVAVTGVVGAYFGQVQLASSSFVLASSLSETLEPVLVLPAAVATGGARAKELEGVFVRVENVSVSDLAPELGTGDREPANEFVVTGGLRVNDYFHLPTPAIQAGEPLSFVQGVLRFANEHSKLEPRGVADLGRRPYLAGVEAPEFVALAADPLPAFTVTLSGALGEAAVVTLGSSHPDRLAVPASVTIPPGETSASVPCEPLAAEATPVTITATFEGNTRAAELVVYDPAAPRTLASATLTPTPLRPGTALTLTVALDAPAGPTPPTVELVLEPMGVISLDSMRIEFAEGQRVATVPGAALEVGEAALTATFGAQVRSVSVAVEPAPTERLPLPGELLVTEVMANPSTPEPGTEWVELYNAGTVKLLLDGISIVDATATNKRTVAAPGLTLEPGAYVVFAYSASGIASLGLSSPYAYGPASATGGIQLGNSGADAFVISVGDTEIDRMAYSATVSGASLCRKRAADGVGYGGDWGNSTSAWASGRDKGSPGAASTAANCN